MLAATPWGSLPKTVQDLRDLAADCERRAARTSDDQRREMLWHVASRWRAIADADEQAFRRWAARA